MDTLFPSTADGLSVLSKFELQIVVVFIADLRRASPVIPYYRPNGAMSQPRSPRIQTR
ncbi:hypothetical protein G6L37_00685 [Agrobacterium rubi]|nr:hypothetical protein [Agrobacterium rubi]NTF23906.1 hypothetical protein [Agrobacterium rubi]